MFRSQRVRPEKPPSNGPRHFIAVATLVLVLAPGVASSREGTIEVAPESPEPGDDLGVSVSFETFCPLGTTSVLDDRTLRIVTRSAECLCFAPGPETVEYETVVPGVSPGPLHVEVLVESECGDYRRIGDRTIEVTSPWERAIEIEPRQPREGDEITLRVLEPCDASWVLEVSPSVGREISVARIPTPGVPVFCDPASDPPIVEERSLGELRSGVWDVVIATLDAPETATRYSFAVLPGWEQVVWLRDGRFRARAEWTSDFGPAPGRGTARGATEPDSDESASFWFFRPQNRELFLKVLDGCELNDHYWVFASGLTDVGVELRLEDTQTSASWSASTEPGERFTPIFDTVAFPCGDP